MELIEVPAGLAGVAVADTSVGDVMGDEGRYHYRGRDATALARASTFEAAAAWVLDGASEPLELDAALPADVAERAGSLDLRSALSAFAASAGLRPLIDLGADERRADALRLIAAFPTLAACTHRRESVAPRPDLGHVANYLWMVTGQADAARARALETLAVLTIDHGFNASTFSARVTASAGADFGACVVSALCTLSGPRHGAVQPRVLAMYDAIGTPDRAEAWMKEALAARQPIMGFGHSVYRVVDPRVAVLREVVRTLTPERFALATAIEDAAAQVLAGRRLAANVDLYACLVHEACGVPPELATATFAMARVVGWCAHVLEQARERKIFRPAAYYVGPPPEE